MSLTADFETGVNGSTLSAGDTGSANAFDAVFSFNAYPKYDTTHVNSGTLAAKVGAVATSNAEAIVWTTSLVNTSAYYGRVYIYLPSLPPTNTFALLNFQNSNGNGWKLAMPPNGKMQVWNQGDATSGSFTSAIATAQWIRVEWHVVLAGGNVEVKLFNTASSTTPTDTLTLSGVAMNGVPITQMRIGKTDNGAADIDFWMDDVVADATSYPGPAGGGGAAAAAGRFSFRGFR